MEKQPVKSHKRQFIERYCVAVSGGKGVYETGDPVYNKLEEELIAAIVRDGDPLIKKANEMLAVVIAQGEKVIKVVKEENSYPTEEEAEIAAVAHSRQFSKAQNERLAYRVGFTTGIEWNKNRKRKK